MTIKSQSAHACPGCGLQWLPHRRGLACPRCGRAVEDACVTAILEEALESARFNQRLYGRYTLEVWTRRSLGDAYLEWGFAALETAATQPDLTPNAVALAALMNLNLEEFSPWRGQVLEFLTDLVAEFRRRIAAKPDEWRKMPEPPQPYRGRNAP